MKSEYTVGDLVYDGNIYDGLNTHMGDLDFYKAWLPKHPKAKILELCCGTGRLTLPIAKAGFDITGIDITPSMLEQAAKKANEAGLQIEFVEGDMRSFDLNEKFDLIFIPFNSIHHLYSNEDFFQMLTSVKKHLKEDGLFLFDCFNPNIQYIVDAGKEQQEMSRYTTQDGREVLIKQQMQYESKVQINRIQWHYFINGQFDSVQNLDMRMYFPQELNTYLEHSGFKIEHKFGSFEKESFENSSEKQIFVCKTS